jgi:hypothetical protein
MRLLLYFGRSVRKSDSPRKCELVECSAEFFVASQNLRSTEALNYGVAYLGGLGGLPYGGHHVEEISARTTAPLHPSLSPNINICAVSRCQEIESPERKQLSALADSRRVVKAAPIHDHKSPDLLVCGVWMGVCALLV